jgi:Protein of unknown function (DUF3179)
MRRLRKLARALLALSASWIFIGCEKQPSTDEILEGMSAENRRAMDVMVNTPFIVEGVSNPEFLSAEECGLQDPARIIGVVINGSARAYPLIRLSAMVDHVVNDNVVDSEGKNLPFTVTYCDMSDCIRVLQSSSDTTANSLEVATLGLLDKGLALKWKGKDFKQMDEVDGLKDVPYERTTWGEWKSKHPDSLVYKGRSRLPRK